MADTQHLLSPLRRWERIKEGWNDAKSQSIEETCLEPLSATVGSIQQILSEIDDFVAVTEARIREAEDR
jgi:hypothetical protein